MVNGRTGPLEEDLWAHGADVSSRQRQLATTTSRLDRLLMSWSLSTVQSSLTSWSKWCQSCSRQNMRCNGINSSSEQPHCFHRRWPPLSGDEAKQSFLFLLRRMGSHFTWICSVGTERGRRKLSLHFLWKAWKLLIIQKYLAEIRIGRSWASFTCLIIIRPITNETIKSLQCSCPSKLHPNLS